jgi:hypothetical protein
MFKTLVSSLSLSPSAVSQLAFYARRLKQEKITRLFSVLAAILIVSLQFAVILAPPTPSNAASPGDLIYGGIVSKSDLLSKYDGGNELRGIYTYLGISRSDIVDSYRGTVSSTDHSLNSMSRVQHSDIDKSMRINDKTYYYRPLFQADHGIASGSRYTVFEGHRSSDGGYFAVMFLCGNIIFKTVPPHPAPSPKPTPVPTPKPTTTPKPVPGLSCSDLSGDVSSGGAPLRVAYIGRGQATNQTITNYIYNFGDGTTLTTASANATHAYTKTGNFKATLQIEGSLGATTPLSTPCSFSLSVDTTPAQIIQSKSALNITQGIQAQAKPAEANDIIKYALTAKNVGGTSINYVIEDDLTDVLEYADVSTPGGSKMVDQTIIWPSVTIAAGTSTTKTFEVRIKSPIPTTSIGISDKYSYDLRIDNVYGNAIQIQIIPPVSKQIEKATTNLPQTGSGATTLIVLLISGFTLFFYLRNRQLIAEVKILRHDYQGGL